jgi:hypothetical protein
MTDGFQEVIRMQIVTAFPLTKKAQNAASLR